jgi:16S rRNA (adenine1518-N6/adenine1519-N6)-dimethyltransferase
MKAKKRLGQNFLHDKNILQKIIDAGEVSANDLVIEIGAGRGALTEELIKHAGFVKALEIDRDLIPVLQMKFKNTKNVEIIHGDVLRFQPPDKPYKVIANIPYYITSPIIRHFLYQQSCKPDLMVLLIQKEVAEKIVSGRESVLSLVIKLLADPKIVCAVPRTAFTPEPKVASAILKLEILKKPRIDCNVEAFFKLIKLAFAQPRKTLVNNLINGLHLERQQIETTLKTLSLDLKIRAEKLSFEEWGRLLKKIGNLKS